MQTTTTPTPSPDAPSRQSPSDHAAGARRRALRKVVNQLALSVEVLNRLPLARLEVLDWLSEIERAADAGRALAETLYDPRPPTPPRTQRA